MVFVDKLVAVDNLAASVDIRVVADKRLVLQDIADHMGKVGRGIVAEIVAAGQRVLPPC